MSVAIGLMLVDNREQVRHFFDHATESRRIRAFYNTVHRFKPERPDDHLVLFRRADRTSDQLDFNLSVSHLLVASLILKYNFKVCRSPSRACPQ